MVQLYTRRNYLDDKAFLAAIPGEMPIESTPAHSGWLERKRQLVIQRYGSQSRIRPTTASADQIHTVFLSLYQRAKRGIADYERTHPASDQPSLPLAPPPKTLDALFAEEAKTPSDELSERIAIMLDSCTEDELIRLTAQHGKERLGLYHRVL